MATETLKVNETFESREYFSKADACIKRGNYKRAAAILNEALKISPNNTLYLSHLGLCICMEGNLQAAESMCRKALHASPLDPVLLVNLGRVLVEQERRKEARDLLTRAYALDNTNAQVALELSRMGVRRAPVLPFLKRSHPVNIFLGKIRYKAIGIRQTYFKRTHP
ncbi:MAG: tetratricopeptide repeat protein [bacterium]|nr:MAG: tetratricopeptide repeat protein [bacterium]